MSEDHSIFVAINRAIKGKYTGDNWRWYNSQFVAEKTTARGLAVDIYRGYAFTPVYKNNWRKKDNFLEAWHIAFDFDIGDHRSSLYTLTRDNFYETYGAFCYSTPSSTIESPKSRMVYIFEEPITDRNIYEDLYRCLLETRYSVNPLADQSTKDAARLFFGSEKCDLRPIWRLLDMETVNGMVDMWRESKQREEVQRQAENPTIVVKPELAGHVFSKTLETMHSTLTGAVDGTKHDTLRRCSFALGGYVEAGYIGTNEALNFLYNAINGMSNIDNIARAKKTAIDCLTAGKAKPIYIERPLARPIGAIL